jgi:hypothetical protein
VPIPGPRTQYGPDTGYRNPGFEQPTRFNHWLRPAPIMWPGRSPGMMAVTLRGCTLGAGQIRRLWRQAVNLVPAQGSYSWTNSSNSAEGSPPLDITRALRYMTKSLYIGSGIDNSRYAALHTVVKKRNMYKTVTVGRGQTRSRPTVRNRLTSFGSRVPTLNQSVEAASNQPVGKATQS